MTSTSSLNESLAQLTSNNLGIRLANGDPGFVDASQALRYRVFYEEMTAHPSPETARSKRDVDTFDDVADHLLVVDRSLGDGPESVVGTYRLVRREAAARHGQFYSVDEYDISAIVNQPGEILELGRSCVDINYRTRHVMDLLWRGIAAYVFHYDITLMFGCASFSGVDPDAIALPLSYLYQNHLAPIEKRPVALPERYVEMNRLPADSYEKRKGLAAVPPLIKGYLRLGGFIGDGAVIDPQFDTIDVCIVVETDLVTDRYYKHYVRKTGESGSDERSSSET
ncbi:MULTISPECIES: GNAT family N-acetyltransferase [unclassified Hwanghaeella]|uniref:GNAT family N-acetyltransferase n=1 Tax=unclassified Hwanghaeella TaxID=2605944 RepID=UPI003B67D47F